MAKIIKKTEIEKDDNTIDNSLELIKYASEVQSRIKDDINSDFVLAKIEKDEDKKSMIEMTNNAYLSKRTIQDLTKEKYWKWNKARKIWEKKELDQETKDRVLEIADQLFDTHMIRHQMTVVLERNKEGNPLLSGLMGTSQAERKQEVDEETIAERIENKIRKKEGKQKIEER